MSSNRHDKFYKVEETPRLGWKDYAFALAWAGAMVGLVAWAI